MLAGAGEDWDVLVVGYVSRFARDLRTAVNARHDLHARGAVILFADERVLSSDEDEWERWAREAVEAEAYSRRLAKRIREGYAAKRRRLGVPGGNKAPLGTVRRGRTIEVDEEAMALVRRVYELAAGGRTDREVSAATGLALKHVAEILTNPFYIGRLWSGEPSALGALIDPATWDQRGSHRQTVPPSPADPGGRQYPTKLHRRAGERAARALVGQDVPVKVAEGIHKVEGLRVGNAYLVRGADGLLLVDSGTPGSAKRILASIARIGGRPDDLRYIVLTHWHLDHVGGAAELKRRTGAQVAIHALDAPVLSGRERPPKGRLAMAALERLLRLERSAPDILLGGGETIAGLEVVHMPGHTEGSIILVGDHGVLFSGDALIADRHGRVRDPDLSLALDPAVALASAARIRALPHTLLLAGHGAPVSAEAHR